MARTFQGAAGDLDKLTVQAAEYVYGQSEPALYATYLMNAGRNADAVAFAKAAYVVTSPEDRPYLLNVWADALQNIGGPVGQSVSLYQEAIRLKPDFWIAYSNLQNVDLLWQNEEAAWRRGVQMLSLAGGRPGRATENLYQNLDVLTWNLLPWRKGQVADSEKHGGIGSAVTAAAPGGFLVLPQQVDVLQV